MHCPKCGSIINDDSETCRFCKVEIPENKGKKKMTAEKTKSSAMQLLEIMLGVLAFIAGKYLGLLYLLFLVAGFLGWYLASLYSKKHEENKLTKFIAWSNVITWFLPVIGFFTSLASFQFNEVYGKKTKLYLVLAIISLVASVINGALGYFMALR